MGKNSASKAAIFEAFLGIQPSPNLSKISICWYLGDGKANDVQFCPIIPNDLMSNFGQNRLKVGHFWTKMDIYGTL